jgi:hypothetical protein
MKPFAVFWFIQYYPAGGWNDFMDWFDTLKEAREFVLRKPQENNFYRFGGDFQIVDLRTGEIQKTYA